MLIYGPGSKNKSKSKLDELVLCVNNGVVIIEQYIYFSVMLRLIGFCLITICHHIQFPMHFVYLTGIFTKVLIL